MRGAAASLTLESLSMPRCARTMTTATAAARVRGRPLVLGSALLEQARCCSITGFTGQPPLRNPRRVDFHVDEEAFLLGMNRVGGRKKAADGSVGEDDGAGGADEEDGSATDDADDAIDTFEISEEEAKLLSKTFKRTAPSKSFLTPKEKRLFTRMIYDAFYHDVGSEADDPAMLYQASLEILWIEEWAEQHGRAADPPLSEDDVRKLVKRSLLERVDFHKPLSYIIGTQPFFGCSIHCEPPLLCPRPETEMWTHWLVHHYLGRTTAGAAAAAAAENSATRAAPSVKVLDVCCGTGCIGVAIAKHVPCAHVTAVDILPRAVEVSCANAAANGVPAERFTGVVSDLFSHFCTPGALAELAAWRREDQEAWTREVVRYNRETKAAGKRDGAETPPAPHVWRSTPASALRDECVGAFDVIVSNPPYVFPEQYVVLPRSILRWESKLALVGDEVRERHQYLYFKELCEVGARLLKREADRHPALRGTPNMVIEIGLQGEAVAELMEKSGLWADVEIHLDYAQQQRWISARSIS